MSKPIFSMESFTEYLGSRDPNETYNYQDIRNCAICQYLRVKGVGFKRVGSRTVHLDGGNKIKLPAGFNHVAVGDVFSSSNLVTFGEAHKRALAWSKENATTY